MIKSIANAGFFADHVVADNRNGIRQIRVIRGLLSRESIDHGWRGLGGFSRIFTIEIKQPQSRIVPDVNSDRVQSSPECRSTLLLLPLPHALLFAALLRREATPAALHHFHPRAVWIWLWPARVSRSTWSAPTSPFPRPGNMDTARKGYAPKTA